MQKPVVIPGRRTNVWSLAFVASTVALTLVGLAWWGLARSEPTPWGEARVEGREVIVDYLGGECDRSASLDVAEDAQKVELTVRINGWSLSCSEVAVPRQVRATLEESLGQRRVVDGACRMDKYRERPACTAK